MMICRSKSTRFFPQCAFTPANVRLPLQVSAVHKTPRLVQEYLDIIEMYKEKGYIMERLMEYEVKMETAEEFYEPYYNTHRR